MSNGFPSQEIANRLREQYPKGTRVELVSMNDPYTTLRPGDRGEVSFVDDAGTIFVNWENGSGLGVAYGEDSIKRLENERRYETGADFWRDAATGYGIQEAAGICGRYLNTQLGMELNREEKQFCRELFAAMLEDTAVPTDPAKVVYPYPFQTADERGEVDFYHFSRERNQACAQAIDDAIHKSSYRANYYNLEIAAMKVIHEYGFERVKALLAHHIQSCEYDGRYSAANKKWAAGITVPEKAFDHAILNAHAILLDDFARYAREKHTELDAERFALPGREEAGQFVHGYEILRTIQFNNDRGLALGHNPAAVEPFVTWQFTVDNGKREFYWGHYKSDEKSAQDDYTTRAACYMRDEPVTERFNPIATVELSTEQNYNMVDGIRNNMAVEKADLTDGQTHEELRELAPETLPGEKPSVLEQIREARKNPAPPSPKQELDRDGVELER
ncbi:DUF4314 domain-containing protein [Christensenellaceae bacterium OttesenSCG-928-L17]|nr:DUF4314 domain-containing protein [Christensenellaceae bacterium OttesenSCG-928-L17]